MICLKNSIAGVPVYAEEDFLKICKDIEIAVHDASIVIFIFNSAHIKKLVRWQSNLKLLYFCKQQEKGNIKSQERVIVQISWNLSIGPP